MQVYEKTSDEELVILLQAGEQRAFTEIYNRYKGLLMVHAYKKLGDFEEAKDVVQDIFSSLWNSHADVPLTRNLPGYLYTLTRNKILNLIEHKNVEQRYASSFTDMVKEQNYVTDLAIREKEMNAIIEREIDALPPKMKEVFLLSRRKHLSHKEIAEQLDISEYTVKNHIKAALKILRVRLGVVSVFALSALLEKIF